MEDNYVVNKTIIIQSWPDLFERGDNGDAAYTVGLRVYIADYGLFFMLLSKSALPNVGGESVSGK